MTSECGDAVAAAAVVGAVAQTATDDGAGASGTEAPPVPRGFAFDANAPGAHDVVAGGDLEAPEFPVTGEAAYDLTYVSAFLRKAPPPPGSKYATVLLNYIWPSWWREAVEASGAVLLADNGAGRLLAEIKKSYIPPLKKIQIEGDFDSLSPEAHEYFRSRGVPIRRNPSQDTTDAMKVLDLIRGDPEHADSVKLLLGAFGGRFDHVMTQFCVISLYGYNVHLHGDGNTAVLVPPNTRATIRVDRSILETVGVLPINGPTKVFTHNLRWDMANLVLDYKAGIVSSCNDVVADEFVIQADKDVIVVITYKEGYW